MAMLKLTSASVNVCSASTYWHPSQMAENSMVTDIATPCRETVKVIRRQRVVRTPAASIARLQSSHKLTIKCTLDTQPVSLLYTAVVQNVN